VFINDKRLTFDVNPRIQNNRVLVPFRTVFENFGAKVSFDPSTQTVTAVKDATKITLYINKKNACVNDMCYTLDTTIIIEKGRTLIPLRFVSEALGYNVVWDSNKESVFISPSAKNESSKVMEINGDKFEKEVLQSQKPVFVDIYASWCGPCKNISPIIDEISKEMSGTLKFVKIDGDIETKKLEALGIEYEGFPTLRIYKNGKVVHQIGSRADKAYLKEQISIGLGK
jgi:thioredoxin